MINGQENQTMFNFHFLFAFSQNNFQHKLCINHSVYNNVYTYMVFPVLLLYALLFEMALKDNQMLMLLYLLKCLVLFTWLFTKSIFGYLNWTYIKYIFWLHLIKGAIIFK